LLIIMLVGLFRRGYHRYSAIDLGRFLWNQGIIWLLLATVSGILPTVFVCLDLNDSLSVIFQFPWLITMSIAATQMYRSLDDFFSSDVKYSPHVLPNDTGHTTQIPGAWGTQATPLPLNRIQVDSEVHTIQDLPLTPERSWHSLDRNIDRQTARQTA